jgi:predicted transcriptional regulator
MDKKKVFSTRLNDDLVRALKHLAIDLNKTLGDLLEESISDTLKKYEAKAPSKPKK